MLYNKIFFYKNQIINKESHKICWPLDYNIHTYTYMYVVHAYIHDMNIYMHMLCRHVCREYIFQSWIVKGTHSPLFLPFRLSRLSLSLKQHQSCCSYSVDCTFVLTMTMTMTAFFHLFSSSSSPSCSFLLLLLCAQPSSFRTHHFCLLATFALHRITFFLSVCVPVITLPQPPLTEHAEQTQHTP